MIPEPTVQNQIARRRKRAHRLLHRNRFRKTEQRARRVDLLPATRPAHHYQRRSDRKQGITLQAAEETIRPAQVAVHDKRVDFGFGELRLRPLRLRFHFAVNMKSAEDAFQNTDFLPIARNHHRGESHRLNLVRDSNPALDHQGNGRSFELRASSYERTRNLLAAPSLLILTLLAPSSRLVAQSS